MSQDATLSAAPVLIVPYVWIGDFVRCHSVVSLLRAQNPGRAVDIVASTLCAPLADYMPGVRHVITADLPRRRLGIAQQRQLAATLRKGHYGQTLVMSRKWKAALAPFLAGIPLRTGFAGEARFGLINDLRWGEKKLPRMIDRMGTLALAKDARAPVVWPLPELKVPPQDVVQWRERRALGADTHRIVALSPGAVGAGKAWPVSNYAELARALVQDGATVWVLGGPAEKQLATAIAVAGGPGVRDLTGNDLRDAILALATADVSVTNDSGLMHVSAAVGAPTVAIFGPTSPWHQKPLNPLAVILEPPGDEAVRERARREGNDAVRHRPTAGVSVSSVLASVRDVIAKQRAS